MNVHNFGWSACTAACAALSVTAVAAASDLRAIYTSIPTSPSSLVPGARDAAGNPTTARWIAMTKLAVRETGDEWVVMGSNDLGTTLDKTLARGTGTSGSMFLQEGQPVQGGGEPGEVYDFFEQVTSSQVGLGTPVSWNSTGSIAYSFRARGGVTTNDEKIAVYNGSTHTIVRQQGEPITSGACAGLNYGAQMGSVQMLNDGTVGFANSVIGGCSFSPVMFLDTTAIAETQVTLVGLGSAIPGEVITGVPQPQWWSGAAYTPDGAHYGTICGTTNPPIGADLIVFLDGNAALREGTAIAGAGITPNNFLRLRLISDGSWFVRGEIAGGNQWAVRSGTLLAKTGDPITSGATENWSFTIGTAFGNTDGDSVVHGLTTDPNFLTNTVIVKNGAQVIAREGDPVDVDGDGQYDDNAFVGDIVDDSVYYTNGDVLYFLSTLRNGKGSSLGTALIRAGLGGGGTPCPANIVNSGTSEGVVDIDDLLAVISAWGPCPAPPAPCPANIVNSGSSANVVDIDDLLAVISAWGPCP